MKFKTTFMLLIVFLLLGTYVRLFELDKPAPTASPSATGPLLSVDPDEVREIILTRGKERIVFTQNAGRWTMTEPRRADARKKRVERLFSLFDLGIIEVLSSDAARAPAYGLVPPEIRLEFRFTSGRPPQALLIGDNAPGNRSCYARMEGQEPIVLLGSLYKTELNQRLDFFLQ